MDRALDPSRSIVVEACAGSGKTWLLVSRVIRLLLDGISPGEILAITFTRRAAQEMQARLRDWLYDLASRDDDYVREFLRERGVEDPDARLPRARSLYQEFLFAKPAITISTFHGWFMQILQRAPQSGAVQLIEQTSELWQEAWRIFLDDLHADPDSEIAQSMMFLFGEFGLANTQNLLKKFADKRSEWWAYTAGQGAGALDFALRNLQRELDVDIDCDPAALLLDDGHFTDAVRALAMLLNASDAQKARAQNLLAPLDGTGDMRFEMLWDAMFTKKNEPRSIKALKGQDEVRLKGAAELVQSFLQRAYDRRQAQEIYRTNCAALRCGAALLSAYQQLKQRQQLLDFGDLEWRVSQLLGESDHAEYMQYKLDSRYRHVLLDEFQDTNPLQWQILQCWFAASAAVDSTPVVFVVGDPKQSIYRFRRADARLFDVVREFLQRHYRALHLKKNETRRNSPAVLSAVNGVFENLPEFKGYERHDAHQKGLPGHVEVLPLAMAADAPANALQGLCNPLLDACPEDDEGAREIEAAMFAEKIREIVGNWRIADDGGMRSAGFSDIMVLVRRRTHLRVYENALRNKSIPFLTSRRGGLLDTLEASDIQALLNFLIAPFADLALAHTLRTPIFSCSDEDLMALAGHAQDPRSSSLKSEGWWQRLKRMAEEGDATPALLRAHRLLKGWIALADKLPVHDLLDRIYFEGDARHRYASAVSDVMRGTVLANLQAFLEIALNVDAGRYPSLPGFLRELAQLRKASDSESPDEGRVSQSGDAIRIYTVHESKGLEAPIVWLLDTNAKPPVDKGFDALIDWPTGEARPRHFSLYADKASRGAMREHYFEQEATIAQREDLNLLYVAMTRAKQALLVSGNGDEIDAMWYQRIRDAHDPDAINPLLQAAGTDAALECAPAQAADVDYRLCARMPTGSRRPVASDAQRFGIWLHALLQHMADADITDELRKRLQLSLNIPDMHIDSLWRQACAVLGSPELARFFDDRQYVAAANEVAYVNSDGEQRRIDRLVELESEVWVLDYKTGANKDAQAYYAQLEEYRVAMQAVYPAKSVRCGVIFADGKLTEVD